MTGRRPAFPGTLLLGIRPTDRNRGAVNSMEPHRPHVLPRLVGGVPGRRQVVAYGAIPRGDVQIRRPRGRGVRQRDERKVVVQRQWGDRPLLDVLLQHARLQRYERSSRFPVSIADALRLRNTDQCVCLVRAGWTCRHTAVQGLATGMLASRAARRDLAPSGCTLSIDQQHREGGQARVTCFATGLERTFTAVSVPKGRSLPLSPG